MVKISDEVDKRPNTRVTNRLPRAFLGARYMRRLGSWMQPVKDDVLYRSIIS